VTAPNAFADGRIDPGDLLATAFTSFTFAP
jgi:hypothetical protein